MISISLSLCQMFQCVATERLSKTISKGQLNQRKYFFSYYDFLLFHRCT